VLAPYRRPFAHREEAGGPPLYRPYPFGFLIDLDLRETGSGFEQAMSLAWFDDLHVRLETPGCDALEAICADGACRVRRTVPSAAVPVPSNRICGRDAR